MLPRFYQTHLRSSLSPNQYVLLNLLIELLQLQKQVRIERLAANLPLPIQERESSSPTTEVFSLSAVDNSILVVRHYQSLTK